MICTLFEKNYHYGLAAFLNSLYKFGYRGVVFAGYKGELTDWAAESRPANDIDWEGVTVLEPAAGLKVYFMPLTTTYHLTNYKPDFLLRLLEGPAKGYQGMYYFDPDIIINAPWHVFETWISQGVALAEDVNSPLNRYHPRRLAWRDIYIKETIPLEYKSDVYINGGFIGLTIENKTFLDLWVRIQEVMGRYIGGLDKSSISKGIPLPKEFEGIYSPFGKTDQDALNIAVEAWNGSLALRGKEAMLGAGGMMPHAIGSKKPWNMNPLSYAWSGRSLTYVDRLYLENANGIITSVKPFKIRFTKLTASISIFINRFYKKN